jgi:hypothetical protein
MSGLLLSLLPISVDFSIWFDVNGPSLNNSWGHLTVQRKGMFPALFISVELILILLAHTLIDDRSDNHQIGTDGSTPGKSDGGSSGGNHPESFHPDFYVQAGRFP